MEQKPREDGVGERGSVFRERFWKKEAKGPRSSSKTGGGS